MLTLLLTVAAVGFVVWLIIQIEMPEVFRKGIIGLAAIVVILYIIRVLGFDIPLPHGR